MTIVKKNKIVFAFLGVLLFVSCSYDDLGTTATGFGERDKNQEKELILKKVEALGLDHSEASQYKRGGSDGLFETIFGDDGFYDDEDEDDEDVVGSILEALNNTPSHE